MFREFTTQKLFFFQARRHVYDGTIQCPKVRVVLGFAQALALSTRPRWIQRPAAPPRCVRVRSSRPDESNAPL